VVQVIESGAFQIQICAVTFLYFGELHVVQVIESVARGILL
jgi:hypothetical protein